MRKPVHGNAKNDGWWYRASTEDRLAQIDGAIECGMTAVHIAMNVGARGRSTILSFCMKHGRRFTEHGTHFEVSDMGRVQRSIRRRGLTEAKKAYWHGEPIDMWSERPANVEAPE